MRIAQHFECVKQTTPSIFTAGITFVNDNDRACALSFFCGIDGAGLYHSASSIVKGCERRLSTLAHGNYNLLIGHRRNIARGIDSREVCSALGIDNNLSDTGLFELGKGLAISA